MSVAADSWVVGWDSSPSWRRPPGPHPLAFGFASRSRARTSPAAHFARGSMKTSLPAYQGAQNIQKDAPVLVVLDFLGGVDAAEHFELLSIGAYLQGFAPGELARDRIR